jgi:hypothetical protein
MRHYRGKLTNPRLASWFGFGLAGFLGIVQKGDPLWLAWLVGIAGVVFGFYIADKLWYWEICPDRLIHQRYFRRVVWPFTEITYVGPMTGLIGTYAKHDADLTFTNHRHQALESRPRKRVRNRTAPNRRQ